MTKKILLIEDNVELADNFALLLEDKGFDMDCAYSGIEALQVIPEKNYDIILCDIMLPDINGYKLFAELKKIWKPVAPIFIFITAKTQRQDLRKGMELGADDYLTKPFTFQELYNSIKTQLDKRNNLNAKNETNKIMEKKKLSGDKDILKYDDYFFFDNKKNPGFQLISSIVLIKSMKDYSHIIFNDDKKVIMRKPMKYWEKRLPVDKFTRVHKQTIINLDFIEKVEPLSSNRYLIKLKTRRSEIEVSQRFSKKIKEFFGR